MKSRLREKAIKLRQEKELSYSEIKKRLNVPKSTLSYWLRDYPLTHERILELRRAGWKKGEASREKFRATMRAKKRKEADKIYKEQKKKLKNISRDSLFVAGLMLYLGEGAKKKESTIVLANTDYEVVLFFIKWLRYFFDVQKEEVRIQLHLYENMNKAQEELYWRRILGLRKTQFYKSSIRKLKRGSFSYSASHNHGTCSLYVFGTKRRMKLMMSIKALLNVYNL